MNFLFDWCTDLGGRKNFHNGAGGTYDCIALMAYYTVCKDFSSLAEIEEMEGSLFLPSFRILSKFVNCNKPKTKPIYYEFTACPVAEFAKRHNLLEIMPALCNPDYESMELIHAKLVRTTTCSNGCKCDYCICGDKDPYLKNRPEYCDEIGYRRNK